MLLPTDGDAVEVKNVLSTEPDFVALTPLALIVADAATAPEEYTVLVMPKNGWKNTCSTEPVLLLIDPSAPMEADIERDPAAGLDFTPLAMASKEIALWSKKSISNRSLAEGSAFGEMLRYKLRLSLGHARSDEVSTDIELLSAPEKLLMGFSQ